MAEGLTLLDVLRRCGCADCRQEHEEAVAEIERLCSELAPIVIANAEVAKLNVEQAETIERLRTALFTEEELGMLSRACYWALNESDETEYDRIARKIISMYGHLSREALQGADEPKPLPTESAAVQVAKELEWHDVGCVKRYGMTSDVLCPCEKQRADSAPATPTPPVSR